MIWIDAGAGASGDMLLGALLDLDPDGLEVAQAAVDQVVARLGAEPVRLGCGPTRRGGLAAVRAEVEAPASAHRRTWAVISEVVEGRARAAFERLAEAEARVHGIDVADVHFHEVGALDAIADVVAVCALWERLGTDRVVVSPVCVGAGSVPTAHGSLPVPAPAVAELLRGVVTFAGPTAHEACTPTGAALLQTLADEWGPQPAMTVSRMGVGAGGRDPRERPNVLRIFVGQAVAGDDPVSQIETTIDDLDPRIYPDVLVALKAAGALEAWLTPVVMKHGRPAVTVTALAPESGREAVVDALFRHTSTLGVRWSAVARATLQRDVVEVLVQGRRVRIKRGWLDGRVVTRQPEYRDAAAAAAELGLPVREVLEQARWADRGGLEKRTGEQKGSDATDGGDSDVRTL